MSKHGVLRRTVNLSPLVAKDLERVAEMAGLSQGDILDIAMAQPQIRMMRAFAHDERRNHVAAMLDGFVDGGQLTHLICTKMVDTLLMKVIPAMLFYDGDAPACMASQRSSSNFYVAGRIPERLTKDSSEFARLRELAADDKFVDDKGVTTKANLTALLREMHNHSHKVDVVTEPFLYTAIAEVLEHFGNEGLLSGMDLFQVFQDNGIFNYLIPRG